MAPVLLVTDRHVDLEHLGDSEIAGYLDQDLSPEERARVESHLELCDRCRAAVLEVRRLSDSYVGSRKPERTPVVTPVLQPTRGRRGWRVASVAAAALAATLILVVATRIEPEHTDTVRGGESIGTTGLVTLSPLRPSEGEAVPAGDIVFSWQASQPTQFRLVVLDETGEALWVHETEHTSAALPADVRLRIGATYFWRVDALAAGIAASTTAIRFSVAP